jgi:A/G-specific adenine glycosylase
MRWYRENRRAMPWRETSDPYAIWISEVMLQQTQVVTVIPYYRRFMAAFPHVTALARADLQQVLKLWEGLGYYSRARNLHKAAGIIVSLHGGRFPENIEEVRALPGIGDYICSAVVSIVYGQPQAVVDGNVKRVLARLFEMDEPVNRSNIHRVFKARAMGLLDPDDPGTFNQAMMELGALVCRPRQPVCHQCPVRRFCAAFKNGTTADFPRRLPKKSTPMINVAVGVVFKKNRILIVQRPEDGLLGGLWEFPGGRVDDGETGDITCRRHLMEKTGIRVSHLTLLTEARHTYTHFRIRMAVFTCCYAHGRVRRNGPVDHAWVTLPALDRYPFHGANLKLFDHVRRFTSMQKEAVHSDPPGSLCPG